MTPRWVVRATFGMSLGALAIATYLTIAHYTSPKALACVEGGIVNCTKVTTSSWSSFIGVPVAVLGVVWSAAMVWLCRPAAWRSRKSWVNVVRVIGSCVGILSVLYLVYAELIALHAICLWCTGMHLLVFGLFVLIVLHPAPERVPTHR